MFLLIYLRLYGRCLTQALGGIRKSWWTLGLPMLLLAARVLIGIPLGALGLVGGFIFGFAMAALGSCYLYFTGGTVAMQKMTFGELRKSFLVYFWSVIGLFFVIWIANLLLGTVLARNPQGATISTALNLVALVALNPAPEVIYSKGTRGGIDTITTCCASWVRTGSSVRAEPAGAGRGVLGVDPRPRVPARRARHPSRRAGGALFHVFMVFRGHLFQELDGSTHRQRMFRYRNQSQ